MSLLNFFIQSDKAVVCVDTAVGREDGHRREASKLMHLAHANTLFACRGHTGILAGAFATSLEAADDFDGIVTTLLERLNQTLKALIEWGHQRGIQDRLLIGAQELLCVGWSKEQQRMVGLRFYAEPGQRFGAGQQMDWALAPGDCFDASTVVPPACADDLVEAATQQIKWTGKNWGWAGCGDDIGGMPIVGGHLLIADLSRGALSVQRIPAPPP